MLSIHCDTHIFTRNAWGQQGAFKVLTVPLPAQDEVGCSAATQATFVMAH